MLTFFLTSLAIICFAYVINQINKVLHKVESIKFQELEHFRIMDDRITSLRDHVRNTEKALYKAIDDRGGHLSDPILKEQIRLLQEEIKHNNSLILKMVVLTDPVKPKPKKPKT